MSLLKQLLLSVTVAIAAILMGTLALSISAAREYLDGQLQSESDNAVTSLALTLSQPSNQDPATRDLLMMALFDGGQFRRIRLTSPQGDTLFERLRGGSESPLQAQRAPAWFEQLLPLRAARAQRAINDGWKQAGQLTLEVENNYARLALWRSSTRLAGLVLAAGLAWALFVVLLLQWFRRVLQQEISVQVRAIGRGSAAAAPGKTHLAELMPLISAIAATHERVQATEVEQLERIESLELEVHRDPVTQLPNRKYFVNELRRALRAADGVDAHGHVLLLRQRDLLALNADLGRAQADAWLSAVGQQVGQLLQAQSHGGLQLARLNGSDFVVLMPALAGPQAMSLVQRIREVLLARRVMLTGGQWCRWSLALTDYAPSSTVAGVLARLDYGLMRAESAGHADVEYIACGDDEVAAHSAGETLWRQMLDKALQTPGALSLAVQPPPGASTRHEASLSLRTSTGETLMGALILPVAVRLGLSAQFDLRAVALGLEWLAQEQPPLAELVVRVSLPSLAKSEFLPALRQLLQTPRRLPRLCLEIDAHGLVAYPQEVTDFCRAMVLAGVGVGLRRLDQQPSALSHLHHLGLRYVKLGADFRAQAAQSPGARQLLHAMTDTAAALDIEVVISE